MGALGRFRAGRFAGSRFNGGRFGVLEVVGRITLDGLTNNPTHGLTAQTGVQLTGTSTDTITNPQWQSNASGSFSDIAGATAFDYNPTIGVDGVVNLSRVRMTGLIDGQPVVSPSYVVRYAPPTANGVIPLQEWFLNQAITPINLSTYFSTGEDVAYTITSGSPAAGVALASGEVSGVPTEVTTGSFDVTAEDSGGAAVQTVSFSVTDLPLSAPILIDSAIFDPASGGNPPSLSHELTYDGARTLTVYGAFVDSSVGTPTKAQLRAGTGGGILEAYSQVISLPSTGLELSGFTSISNDADGHHYFIEEDGPNPQSSLIEVLAVSGINFTAATVQTAVTDIVDASTWTLTFDKPIYGTGDPADWAVTSLGDSPTIDSVIVNGTTTVVLNLSGDLPEAGDALTASYSGGDLVDEDGNTITDISGQVVTNNLPAGGFTENAVNFDGQTFFTATAPYPSNIRSAVFMASFEVTENGSRQCLSGWGANSSSNALHADYNSSAGTVNIRFDMEDSLGNAIALFIPFAGVTDRFHVIAAAHNDGTGLYGQLAVRDETGATYTVVSDSNTGVTGVATLAVDVASAPRVFNESAGLAQDFQGRAFRNAAWFSPTGASLADVSTVAVQDRFTDGDAIVDPAIAQAEYGTPIYDFNGTSADYNAATQDGSATYTITGATT
ncbi:hypothetical protein [uncultured Roseobacter sp.]|uniref:hypothetical protein n=1 Tax=uncultured Roseobacter sp. TaxID=114847 RepID=UPI00260554C5|nr:hypothetical protein [uncultured Roseobacter sp.]